MITYQQVRKLMKFRNLGLTIEASADKSGMSIPTARKYLEANGVIADHPPRHWKTRKNPFEEVWSEVEDLFGSNQGLEAQTIFQHLQKKYPGRFPDGQLRTFQRRVKEWRIFHGSGKEVIFDQIHYPGRVGESDFSHMDTLGITILGHHFKHLIYHFVLTYSNWETGTICFTESFESLSDGLQNALWELGAVPQWHRTDCLSSAVNNLTTPREFTKKYKALLDYYRLGLQRTQPGSPNENGDVEQRHHRLKRALDQALMLRGSRDFGSRQEYQHFLREIFAQLNSNRQEKLAEEMCVMRDLPNGRLDTRRKISSRVSRGSTIRVLRNTYSVDSRLIGQEVDALAGSEDIELRYGGRLVERLPRIHGRAQHRIEYRHIIHSLIRKPGAFADYKYRDDLFPTSYFRMAYDALKKQWPTRADKEYLRLLELSANTSEQAVNKAIQVMLSRGQVPSIESVEHLTSQESSNESIPSCIVHPVSLEDYDDLLDNKEVE